MDTVQRASGDEGSVGAGGQQPVHTWDYLGYLLLSLLHKLHHQPLLLRPLQRDLPADLRQDPHLQVGQCQETAGQQVLLWLMDQRREN